MFHTALANGVFCISNIDTGLIPFWTTGTNLMEQIQYYLANEKLRRKFVKQARKTILQKDTYFHRVAELSKLVGLSEWEKSALETNVRFQI
jgi:hypothetical protein